MRAGARGQDSGFRGWDSGIRQGWLVGGKSQDGWLYGCLVLNFALTITAGVPVDDLRAQTTLPRPGLVLSVRVYNYAHASRGMLSYAENEAGRIIGATGVAVAWLDCLAPQGVLQPAAEQGGQDCSGPVSGTTVVLRILPRSTPASTVFRDTMFGYADGTALASVFYSRIEDLACYVNRDETEIPVIFGHAMAHEIGHLLLGSASHSKTGIMCGQWDRNYLRSALVGREVFSLDQIERIQAEVLRRIQGFEVAPF